LIPEQEDIWWTVTSEAEAEATGEELRELLETYGLPALERVSSIDRLRELWKSGRCPGLTDWERQEYLRLSDPT
jgi:hypothetical protein